MFQLSNEVASLKTKIKSDIQLRDIAIRQDKMINILENRLEVATKRFNISVAQNTQLRNEIEDMLKERTQFTALWNKLINQLNTGKQIINDLIEQATIAFNQRDEELNKIQALRERWILNESFILNISIKCTYIETYLVLLSQVSRHS